MDNLLLLTDVYKYSHWKMYPPKLTKVYSYFEARKPNVDVLFFGLHYYIKRYLTGCVVTKEKIDEAQVVVDKILGPGVFNRAGWQYIVDNHNGYLPIKICAVPEGTIVSSQNVLMTVENTDPNCAWLTNFIETLLVQVWYPCTVATQSWNMRRILAKYAYQTTDDDSHLDYQLHDFGFRGVTCPEQAMIGGLAHLVNFNGTDTTIAYALGRKYYDGIEACSIPASEHSVMCIWGPDKEQDCVKNILTQYPTKPVSIVGDSYNIVNFCKNVLNDTEIYQLIINRRAPLVIRPDSGDPIQVLFDGPNAIFNILAAKFNYTTNKSGYRVLPPYIRVIQGDGIDQDTMTNILDSMTRRGWASNNIVFGSGGGLLQKMNRDTLGFAFKCSYCKIDGKSQNVYKLAPGKQSKKGKLILTFNNVTKCEYETLSYDELYKISNPTQSILRPVFNDGVVLIQPSLIDIRAKTRYN